MIFDKKNRILSKGQLSWKVRLIDWIKSKTPKVSTLILAGLVIYFTTIGVIQTANQITKQYEDKLITPILADYHSPKLTK